MKTLIYLVKETEAEAQTANHVSVEAVHTPTIHASTDEVQDAPDVQELTDDDKKLLEAVGEADGITYADLAKALEKSTETGAEKLRFYSWVRSLRDRGLLKTKTIEVAIAAA